MAARAPFVDEEAARLIAPLLDRARERFGAYVDSLPPERRLIGFSSLTLVLRADASRHFDVCLRHVIFNRATVYIMLEDASLVALLCPTGPSG